MNFTSKCLVLIAVACALAGCPHGTTSTDGGTDGGMTAIDWNVQAPFKAPTDALMGTQLTACPVLGVQQCSSGTLQQCAIMDTTTGMVATTPDPLFQRAVTYDRWYDLFHSPDGQSAERVFNQREDAGTAEASWSAISNFASYTGTGDTAIWSGASLNTDLMRYLVTGSAVDYQRVEDKVRTLVTLFDVTGIPGYLARNHFIRLPAGAPPIDSHIVDDETADGGPGSLSTHPITNPSSIPGLPAEYLTGVKDPDGGVWQGTPMWTGFPSIDQYTGMTVSLPAAYGLLKDDTLKQKVGMHLSCYLKRLQRLEMRNVQKSPDAVALMKSLLGDGTDVTKLDTLVVYYLPQYNALSAPTFDMTCPANVTLTAGRIIDASSDTFEIDTLNLIADLNSGTSGPAHATGIDHYYIVNVRGADAVHLMNLAAMAYYFTGDTQFQSFMNDVLLTQMNTASVATGLNLGVPNKWCRRFYDAHISVVPLWAFTNLLGPSTLKTDMQSVLWNQGWLGDGQLLDDAELGFMAAADAPTGTDAGSAITQSLRELNNLGGNGGVLLDPRRTYALPYATVTAGAGVTTECPTEDQRTSCETGPTIFGVSILGTKITAPCTGAPGECMMDGGVCAPAMSVNALPVELRGYADFVWQRNPYEIGASFSPEAQQQSPGLDLTEEYWLARYYGFTTAGQGQALAWNNVGTCP